MKVGTVDVRLAEERQLVEGRTLSDQPSSGVRDLYVITDRGGLIATVADTRWDANERDVRMISCEGPDRFHNLKDALRLSVKESSQGRLVCDLRLARVKLNDPTLSPALYLAGVDEIERGSGVALASQLESMRAEVGVRADLLDDTSNHRNGACVAFPEDETMVPVLAYIATRILPVKNMLWAAGTNTGIVRSSLRGQKSPDRLRRVYVVLLDVTTHDKTWLYVGQTGVQIPLRFRQHLAGYRSSRWVKKHGVRLTPELYELVPPFESVEQSEAAERVFAEQLEQAGFGVKGGH